MRSGGCRSAAALSTFALTAYRRESSPSQGRSRRVEQRFLRAEALRHQHHRGARRIERAHQPVRRAGVGIVEEMQAEAPVGEILQRLDRQARAEVGAADADVDTSVTRNAQARGQRDMRCCAASACVRAAAASAPLPTSLRSAVCSAGRPRNG
jgi:hypothetical protein